MSKIYCGVGKVPKGYKLGSMKDCVQKGQIRYYGVKKIDPKILALKDKKVGKSNRDTIVLQMVTLRGRVKGLTKKIAEEKNTKAKDKLKQDLVKAKEELEKVTAKFRKLENSKASLSRSRKGKSARKSRTKKTRSRQSRAKRSKKSKSKSRSRKSRKSRSRV